MSIGIMQHEKSNSYFIYINKPITTMHFYRDAAGMKSETLPNVASWSPRLHHCSIALHCLICFRRYTPGGVTHARFACMATETIAAAKSTL